MKKIMCIWMVLSLIGCTTFKPVEHLEVSLPDIIVVDETYKFTTNSGDVSKMKVIDVSADKVVGTLEGGNGQTINAADILSIEVETIDGVKTTLAVIGGTISDPSSHDCTPLHNYLWLTTPTSLRL